MDRFLKKIDINNFLSSFTEEERKKLFTTEKGYHENGNIFSVRITDRETGMRVVEEYYYPEGKLIYGYYKKINFKKMILAELKINSEDSFDELNEYSYRNGENIFSSSRSLLKLVTQTICYTYHKDNKIKTIEIIEGIQFKTITKEIYNEDGLLIRKITNDEQWKDEAVYTYDKTNRLTKKIITAFFSDNSICRYRTEFYKYNDSHQLIRIDFESQSAEDTGEISSGFQIYNYDVKGNLILIRENDNKIIESRSFDDNEVLILNGHEIRHKSSIINRETIYLFNSDGKIFSKEDRYSDDNNNIIRILHYNEEGKVVCYEDLKYDNNNLLKRKIRIKNGNFSDLNYYYTYDNAGLLIKREEIEMGELSDLIKFNSVETILQQYQE